MIEIEEFMKLTVEQPGLRKVFDGIVKEDFIRIHVSIVQGIGLSLFQFYIQRLHDILLPCGFESILECEKGQSQYYILRIINENYKA